LTLKVKYRWWKIAPRGYNGVNRPDHNVVIISISLSSKHVCPCHYRRHRQAQRNKSKHY